MSELRTHERLKAHYEVEVELADRLRWAPPDARRRLYSEVYDELFERVPDHPQLTRSIDPSEQVAYARRQLSLIRQYLPRGGRFVEIGAGDCALARLVAERARSVTAVEVSVQILPSDLPANVEPLISDGVSLPIPPETVDLVYSNQVMEHLHPDDAIEQLSNIITALKPGGRYLLITPNRLTGPHDVSATFDNAARGFHLREYTYGELLGMLKAAGFRKVRVVERAQGTALARLGRLMTRASPRGGDAVERLGAHPLSLPPAPFLGLEKLARAGRLDRSGSRLISRFLGIQLLAQR